MSDENNRENIESAMSCIGVWAVKMRDEKHHNGHVNKVFFAEL